MPKEYVSLIFFYNMFALKIHSLKKIDKHAYESMDNLAMNSEGKSLSHV